MAQPTRRLAAHLTLLALSILAAASGCSQSSGGAPRLAAPGRVILPAGSDLKLGELRVVGALGAATIAADGKFTAVEPDAGPALVGLLDRSDRLLLMGWVDASDASGGEVSARQTAVALLFHAVGANLLPAGMWREALAIIGASPQADAVAAVVAGRVAANPTALLDGDPAIADAVAAAARELVPAAPAAGPTARRAPSADEGLLVTAGAVAGLSKVIVDTSATQSGITVRLDLGSSGIVIDNAYRRPVKYLVYRTGYLPDAEGAVEQPVPWEELTHGLLQGTSGATSAIGILTDLATGTIQYASTTTPPVSLPLNPPTARRTSYVVVVVGAGQDDALPAALAVGEAAGLVGAWSQSANDMTSLLLVKDFFLPAVFAFVPAGSVAKALEADAGAAELAADVMALLVKGGVDVGTPIAAGDYKGAAKQFVSAMATNGTVRAALYDKLIGAGILKVEGSASELVASSTAKILVLLKIVDAFYTATDIGIVTTQAAQSSIFSAFEAKAVKPKVKITPSPSTVSKGGAVSLTCQVADITGTFNYHWQTTGTYGHLEDDRGHTGKAFDSTMAVVRYVLDDDQVGLSDTVTVEAWLVPDGGVGQRTDLGQGEATVTIACGPVPNPILSGCGSSTTVSRAVAKPGDILTISFTQRSGGLCGGATSVELNVPGQFLSYPGGTLSAGVVTFAGLPTDPSSASRTLTYQLSATAADWKNVDLCPRELGYYEPPGPTTGPYVTVETARWWDLVPFTVTLP